jgi:hypothetical protein
VPSAHESLGLILQTGAEVQLEEMRRYGVRSSVQICPATMGFLNLRFESFRADRLLSVNVTEVSSENYGLVFKRCEEAPIKLPSFLAESRLVFGLSWRASYDSCNSCRPFCRIHPLP